MIKTFSNIVGAALLASSTDAQLIPVYQMSAQNLEMQNSFEPDLQILPISYLLNMNMITAQNDIMLMNLRGTQFDMEVLQAYNLVRKNPKVHVQGLKDFLKTKPGGRDADIEEVIAFLQNQKPMGALKWNDKLAQSAKDHVMDTGPKHIKGHTGSDGSSAAQRINKYLGNVASGENIAYGKYASAEAMVKRLIIDKDVPSRSHRKIIFNPNYTEMGSYTQTFGGKGWDKVSVQDFKR